MSWVLINMNYLFVFILILIGGFAEEVFGVFLLFPASIIITNGMELISKKMIQSIVFGIIILIQFVVGVFYNLNL
jgi:hypothetical protein